MSDQNGQPAPATKVIVNGREREVPGNLAELTYAQVVKLAFGETKGGDAEVVTIAYSGGVDGQREGQMVPGDMVKVKAGMVFNVKRTNRS